MMDASADRAVGALLGLAAGGAPAAWPHDDFVHAWWVEPGQLLAGEYPGHPDPRRAEQKVGVLVDAGIRTFVDLTTPEDHLEPYAAIVEEAAASRALDLRHVPFPIPDLGVVADERYATVGTLIDEGLTRGGVYVHCWGGVGRTGTVIGSRLAAGGLGYDAVVDRLTELRAGTRKAGRPAPESRSQHDVLRRLAR